jgi:hypothetical protein
MDISLIIAALKQRCPSFANRVTGAAEYKRLAESVNLDLPAAYVIPLDDEAGEMQTSNGYLQEIRDAVAIVVVMSNAVDERGQTSISTVQALRSELWAALLGWMPDAVHGRIEYEGGQLLDLDRARLYYQFEFSAPTEITESDTWQGISNAALTPFDKVSLTVDTIDPHDPNLGSTGPDGRAEATATIPVSQI